MRRLPTRPGRGFRLRPFLLLLFTSFREDLFSENQKTLSQENVPNCVQTLSECSANIRYPLPQGEALRRCVSNGGTKKGKKVRMPTKISDLARRPLWIITCYRNNRMEVLTLDPDGDGGGSLPVFSFEEEAKTFLGLSENDQNGRRWRSRETTAGELVSVLLAPCVEVRQ